MKREDCRKSCIDIYEYIQQNAFGRMGYGVNLSTIEASVLNKYLDYLDKTYGLRNVGMNFLVNWIEFAFNYWFENRENWGRSNFVYFNWIFGKKAIERHEKIKDQDSELDSFINRGIRYEGGLSAVSHFVGKESRGLMTEQYIQISQREENQKSVYLNTIEGFAWCLASTTLYNHLSELCMICTYKESCKKSLKLNYPLLFKLRKYE